jgi:hypothetical protein
MSQSPGVGQSGRLRDPSNGDHQQQHATTDRGKADDGGNRDGALPLCRRVTWTGVQDRLATRIHDSLVHQGEQAEGDKGDTTECKGFRKTPSFLGRRRRSVAG